MSVRPLLVPATALVVAFGPAVAAPPVPARPALPSLQVEAIQLAGIGQDIYNAVTPVVQYAVGGVSYLVNFTPLIGGPIAAQININYFQGFQPSVAATVDYAAALLHAPLDFFPITGAYARELYGIGYDVVSAELRFIGLPELPPRPAAAAMVAAPRAAAVVDSNLAGTQPAPGDKPAVDPSSDELSPTSVSPIPAVTGPASRRIAPIRETALPAAEAVATVDDDPSKEPVTAADTNDGPTRNVQFKPTRRGHHRDQA